MAESFSFTYGDLIDKTVSLIKSYYNNIDAYSSKIQDNPSIIELTKGITVTSVNGGHTAQQTSTVSTKWNAKLKTLPDLVKSDDLKLGFGDMIVSLCKDKTREDTVTAKGMLAFISYIAWYLQKGTYVIQTKEDSEQGYTLLVPPNNSEYTGLSKVEDNFITKNDFVSIQNLLATIAVTAQYYKNTAEYEWIITSSSCSSCSSSCSSSSCSSSCSSSSCSSSSSCYFIAYMKLV
jgi:hypothetical protein